MSKFIYSISDVFSEDPQKGCLGQNGATRYLIDVYQRGYKWQSNEEWDSALQVNTLLRDIHDAWVSRPESQYYLQFITVKLRRSDNTTVLEVIDGQQRLTTLSILLSVFHDLGIELEEHLKESKIDYAVTPESQTCLNGFFEGKMPSDALRETDQTIHFMCAARENVKSLLTSRFHLEEQDDGHTSLEKFFQYFREKTVIIVNLVHEEVSSETVFENLNGRKVLLTDVELIKGLLLCQAARNDRGRTYRQVLEHRGMMGRTWDEIERWLADRSVGMFFFGEADFAMYDLLLLVALRKYEAAGQQIPEETVKTLYLARMESGTSQTKHYRLFNKYYGYVKAPQDALSFFNELEDVYWRLRDIYDDTERFNSFGYILFRKGGIERINKLNVMLAYGRNWRQPVFKTIAEAYSTRSEKMDSLEAFMKSYKNGYGKGSENLRADLMLLNCFVLKRETAAQNKKIHANDQRRFPFYDTNCDTSKSLEHVQPQNPKTDDKLFGEPSDKERPDYNPLDFILTLSTAKKIAERDQEIKKIIEGSEIEGSEADADFKNTINTVVAFENGIRPQTEDAKARLVQFYGALMSAYDSQFESKHLSDIAGEVFGDNETTCKDSIGNIVIVTRSLNSAFGNRNFGAKRRILRDKLNYGGEVPPHTFNVFSKISGEGQGLDCWCIDDVVENAKYVLGELYGLRKALADEYGEHKEAGK